MIEKADNAKDKLNSRDCLILAGLIGIIIFIISLYISFLRGGDQTDFKNILVPARAWLAGKDIYLPFKLALGPFSLTYPFTTYLLSVPFSWLPDRIAAAVFNGLGCGLLAWFILQKGKNWYLLIFLSWPLLNNLIFAQFAPYIASMFFTPNLLFLLFIKPQLALPFVLIQKPSRIGFLLAGILLLVSLALYPMWPLDWLKNLHIQNYIGYPPLFTLPLGPLLLLALIRYRDKRAWLLLLLAAMPQRMVYDQLGVLLVAENIKEQLFLVICSWISFPVLNHYMDWGNVPWGWQNWVLIESYLPALFVVLLPTFRSISQAYHKVLSRHQMRSSL
jgi:hypothetical protein